MAGGGRKEHVFGITKLTGLKTCLKISHLSEPAAPQNVQQDTSAYDAVTATIQWTADGSFKTIPKYGTSKTIFLRKQSFSRHKNTRV